MALAMSENVAVPLSAATTKYVSSPSWRVTWAGGLTPRAAWLSVTSNNPRISIW